MYIFSLLGRCAISVYTRGIGDLGPTRYGAVVPTFPPKSGGIPDLLVHSPRNIAPGLPLRCSHRPHQRPTKILTTDSCSAETCLLLALQARPNIREHQLVALEALKGELRVGSTLRQPRHLGDDMTQRHLPCKQHAGRLPARTNVSVPFGLHTFCVLFFTSCQVGVVTSCGFPNGALSTGVENAFGGCN